MAIAKIYFFMLNNLILRTNSNHLVLEAINFFIKYQADDAYKAEYYPVDCGVITKGIISPLDLKVIQNSEERMNRLTMRLLH
jgi:hypothetical protein